MGKILNAKDIKILNQGQQIRKAILKEYYTIESFYNQNNITNPSLKSLKCYLSSDSVSETFKILIVKLLKVNWNDIVKTEEEQLKGYINQITKDIFLYTKDTDLGTLEKLKILCKPYKVLYATMYQNIGLYFYNTFRYSDAVVCLLFAIELLHNNQEEYNLIIQIYIDLLKICFREQAFDKTEKLYNDIKIIVNKNNIDSKLLYQLWYVLGQLYRNGTKDTDNVTAQTMFYRALKLASINIETGNTYIQIGLTYKQEGNFNGALKYYKLAQDIYDKDDIVRQSIVLNNLAEVYKLMDDKNKALTYVEKALNLIKDERATDRYLIYLTTKLEIIQDVNDCKQIIESIENILLSNIYNFNKKFIITALNTVVSVIIKLNDYENINSLISIIEKIISNFMHEGINTHSNHIHNNFISLLENYRNKLIYINNKKLGGNNLEKFY